MTRPAMSALLPLALATAAPPIVRADDATATPLRFEVRLAPGLVEGPVSGRLLVVLDPRTGRAREPRFSIGRTGMDAPPLLGRDVAGLEPGGSAALDAGSAIFPLERLDRLPPGEYLAQAVLHVNKDLNLANAPGDFYGEPALVRLDPARGGAVALELNRRVPEEQIPDDSEYVRYLKIPSKLLSDFHGRPMFLRAAVILPRGFEREPTRRYPLRVQIGGYGSRFTDVPPVEAEGSGFRRLWLADDTPRFLLLKLDGAGPLGDPYQVDSANHGPYGRAITEELIPHVERNFRGIGAGRARVLDGGSTGGWVALALQVFYPESFNGAWASCPDSVDFRSFQLVNIYEAANAYVNAQGFERPAARTRSGDVRDTMRHECGMENVLGLGDSWAMSGGQWGAWNATYGPRGADGRPAPLWDPKTGAIDRSVVDYWRRYDLRLILERDWPTLGPRLRGKLHLWVGEADDYFLNNAVHRLDAFLKRAEPPADATVEYGPGEGHCWIGITEAELMRQMAAATGARP
jgi:hypothetical protein